MSKNSGEILIISPGGKEPWSSLLASAATSFELDGRTWRSVEHYYRYRQIGEKYRKLRKAIADSGTAAAARAKARMNPDKETPGWQEIQSEVLLTATRARIEQDYFAKALLMSSGDRMIIVRLKAAEIFGQSLKSLSSTNENSARVGPEETKPTDLSISHCYGEILMKIRGERRKTGAENISTV